MNELFKKVLELEVIINADVTTVNVGNVAKLGTDADTLEMIREEYSNFMMWLHEWCGDREKLLE